MSATSEKVLLRHKSGTHSERFGADHAKRLLAYPNSQWQEAKAEKEEAPKKEAKPQ